MRNTPLKSEENDSKDGESSQEKLDAALETIETIRCRLDELESRIKGHDDRWQRWSQKVLSTTSDHAKAHPMALLVASSLLAGAVATRLLGHRMDSR